MAKKEKPTNSTLAQNRKARHDYTILDSVEAGIVLLGSEVKSIKEGNIQLKEGYIRIKNGEVFMDGVYIKSYENTGGNVAPDTVRTRKLLLNKREILRMDKEVALNKLAIVPLKVYLKKGKIKIEIGLGKGKKSFDKRDSIKDRDSKRELERLHKKHNR